MEDRFLVDSEPPVEHCVKVLPRWFEHLKQALAKWSSEDVTRWGELPIRVCAGLPALPLRWWGVT